MNRAQALAVAALLATGCIPDTNGLDPLRSAASVCPVLFDLLTAKLGGCGGFAPYYTDQFYASARANCASIAAAEQAGRIGYDRALAQACVDQLSAPGCAQLENACNDPPFLPRVGVGGVCGTEFECTSASAGCYSPNLTCPSHCLAPGNPGARCSGIDPPCGSTSYCDSTAATPTCQARAVLFAPCSPVPCLPGLYCDPSTSVCQPQVGQGSSCTYYLQCNDALGLWCDFNTPPYVCKPLPTASPAGGRCDYPYSCNADAWCDSSATPSTCKAKVPVPQACTSANGCSTPSSACIQDSAGSTLRHCKVLLTEGTACTPGFDQCQRGLYCRQPPSGAATCAPWPAVGGTCGTISGEDVPCAGTAWCQLTPPTTTGTCTAPVAPGQPCSTSRECGEGNFSFTGPRCEDVPGQGLICVASCPAP